MLWNSLHRNVKIRISMSTFERIGNAIITPFMAIFFSERFGVETAGLLMFFAVLGSLFASFYGGYISDLLGRKVVIVYAELCRAVVLLLMALFNSPLISNSLVTFILFVCNNILIGIAIPAINAMIIDSTTPSTRQFVFTLNYWSNNLSLAVGAILGSIFYQGHLFYLFLYTGISCLVISLSFARYVSESKESSKDYVPFFGNALSNILRNYREVFANRVFVLFVVAGIINLAIELQLGNYISIRLSQQFGIQHISILNLADFPITGIQMFGSIRAANTILVVLFAALISKLTKKFNIKFNLYLGTALFTIGYVVLGFSNSFWLLALFTVILTIGELIYVPFKQVLLASLIPDGKRSVYLAVNSLNSRTAAIIASFFISIGAKLPPLGMSVIFAVMGLVTILLYSAIFEHGRVILEQRGVFHG